MSDVVRIERDGPIAVLTLNRPESLNAMNPEMLSTMCVAGKELAEDPAVRCVVVTGAGRAFSAGGDVKAMAEGNAANPSGGLLGRVDTLRQQEEISRLLFEMPKPTIAAINGVAAGAGLSVALAADLRIASDQARFTTAFAKVGFSGDFGGTWLLQRLVGPSRAKELYFLSDIIGAEEALALGLVNRVVPHEQLLDSAMALAKKLAAGPTLAYGRIKDNIAFGTTNTFSDALTREAENMIASGLTEDHRNAALAFVQKREPEFAGR
ncbi:MAG: enoyl-CoA hydratase [Chloroflexi bacterium CFX7]|nr:enoyl-CoA hydratase [Chloroflexi bacterium CFX7]